MKKINRRQFIQASGAALLASQLPLDFARGSDESFRDFELTRSRNRIPIVQGPTERSSATFAVMHAHEAFLRVDVLDPNDTPQLCQIVDSGELRETGSRVSHVVATGLVPGVLYRLRVSDVSGSFVDERTFKTLDLDRRAARFAAVSCMDESFPQAVVEMWNTLARESVDFVVFCGDTVYADKRISGPSEVTFSRRFAESRKSLGWFRQPHLIPSFATWDDHDFGANNADSSFKHADITRRLFELLWGPRLVGSAWNPGLGVGSSLEAFGQRFYFLDGRTYRDKRSGKKGRMWGAEQTDWLFAELEKNSTPAWLFNGSQFFGGYLGKESYEGDHSADFKDLLERLSKIEAPVAFVSGDVHFSEVMEIESAKIGYRTYEFTSSSIHSLTVPYHQHRARNPRRMVSEWRHNFLVFDSNFDSTTGGEWNVRARCVLQDNVESFARDVQIIRG